MRAEHRQRWQAPQQNKHPSRDAPPPIAAADEDHDGDDTRCDQNNVSRPPKRNQIGVVLVGRCENEDRSGEPDEDDADTLEDLHKADGACGDGTIRLPVSNLPHRRERISTSARKLHKNPELLLRVLQATAHRHQIVRSANWSDHRMPVPTRLANDGWWLCERPAKRPTEIGMVSASEPRRYAILIWSARSDSQPVGTEDRS